MMRISTWFLRPCFVVQSCASWLRTTSGRWEGDLAFGRSWEEGGRVKGGWTCVLVWDSGLSLGLPVLPLTGPGCEASPMRVPQEVDCKMRPTAHVIHNVHKLELVCASRGRICSSGLLRTLSRGRCTHRPHQHHDEPQRRTQKLILFGNYTR